MSKFTEKIVVGVMKLGMKIAGADVSQEEALEALGEVTITDGMPKVLREAAGETAILLENNGVLPFKKGTKVSVFGRVQNDWFYTGYGSGGDVKKPYGVNLIDGLKSCEDLVLNTDLSDTYEKWCKENPIDHGVWGHWPRFYPEMPLTVDLVKKAKQNSDNAVFVIGRSSGEDRENALEKGSFYVTDEERTALHRICEQFDNVTLLLNIGSVMDMSWLREFGSKIGAVMIVWQGGMESGNAVADLLCGKVSPSGKLTDTIAKNYEDYPSSTNFGNRDANIYEEDIYVGYRYFETFNKDAVVYPFGYGLSYTKFDINFDSAEQTEENVTVKCTVKNIGEYAGKEAVQIYVSKPCGKLGNPARELAAFGKTKVLECGESETLEIVVPIERFWSYDDNGASGFAHSYVMEKGEYALYVGSDVRSAEKKWSYYQDETVEALKLKQCSAPQKQFDRFVNTEEGLKKEPVTCRKYDLKQVILENIGEGVAITGDKGYKLSDVENGTVSMENFVAQLSLDELEAISRGDYKMDSPLGAKGNAGAMGGILQSLRDKGIPPMITTDGPSGIRLLAYCSLIPNGTALASTFNTGLVEKVYAKISEELKAKGSDILLAPGMNIHRSHLCGRNFEYYSEDPVVTGLMGAAAVKGIQTCGGSACPKHYACNNQEVNRTGNDSRLSERALREIYLKGFEICVKTAHPNTIMTSYNKINGVWGHYNYELCERILREEWGFDGVVMTDWWMRPSKSQEFPKMRDQAYRVRGGVNVLMPGGDRVTNCKPDGTLLKTYGKKDGITLYEMQRNASFVLKLCMKKYKD
ncbi:MAG: glycoside hydrolase family 3 C-terminal domain-containing protein [Clostridia bacterium]|nr:glycoside hydrolase family 3 C-terminal domain-containing protein [Clostridia bacterium]